MQKQEESLRLRNVPAVTCMRNKPSSKASSLNVSLCKPRLPGQGKSVTQSAPHQQALEVSAPPGHHRAKGEMCSTYLSQSHKVRRNSKRKKRAKEEVLPLGDASPAQSAQSMGTALPWAGMDTAPTFCFQHPTRLLQPHSVLSFLRGDTGKTLRRVLYVMDRCSKSQAVADREFQIVVIYAVTTQLLTDRALPAGSAPHLAQCAEPGSQLSLQTPADKQTARAPSSCSWLLMRSPLLKGDPILLTNTDLFTSASTEFSCLGFLQFLLL